MGKLIYPIGLLGLVAIAVLFARSVPPATASLPAIQEPSTMDIGALQATIDVRRLPSERVESFF